MNAADLSDEMKRNLLDQVRRQVGDANYDRAVSEVGEDRLLDLCLEKTPGAAAPPKPGCLVRGFRGTWELVSEQWWVTIPLLVGLLAGERAWSIASGICLGLLFLNWLMNWISRIGIR